MKIAFIEPRPPDFHVFTRFNLPRLGILIMGTILKQAGHQVEVMVETMRKLDYKRIMAADLVGISSITSTATRSYALANELTARGKTVVMGGPHPSFFAEEALEHCHYVIRGEAEKSIVAFIQAIEQKSGLENVRGLSYRVGKHIFHNPAADPCLELDTLPFPDFSLMEQGIGDIIPMITSRGCPYDCSFCAVTELFGRKYRSRSPESVIEELKKYHFRKNNTLFFYDDNFTANPENSKRLLRLMIKNKITPQWTAQVRVDCSRDEELLELMKRSGAFFVYLGLESVNPDTLKSYNKKLTLEQIRDGLARFHQHGIRVHGMFVLGADTDNVETIRETTQFSLQNRIDTLQYLILTPIPGTRLFRQMAEENRLLTRDWSLYDGHHVVYRPARMTPYQLQKETVRAMAKFYSVWQLIRLFVRVDFATFIYRSYGNHLVNRWKRERNTRKYFKLMKKISRSATAKLGDNVRKTAEDIKAYFNKLKSSVTEADKT